MPNMLEEVSDFKFDIHFLILGDMAWRQRSLLIASPYAQSVKWDKLGMGKHKNIASIFHLQSKIRGVSHYRNLTGGGAFPASWNAISSFKHEGSLERFLMPANMPLFHCGF